MNYITSETGRNEHLDILNSDPCDDDVPDILEPFFISDAVAAFRQS